MTKRRKDGRAVDRHAKLIEEGAISADFSDPATARAEATRVAAEILMQGNTEGEAHIALREWRDREIPALDDTMIWRIMEDAIAYRKRP